MKPDARYAVASTAYPWYPAVYTCLTTRVV